MHGIVNLTKVKWKIKESRYEYRQLGFTAYILNLTTSTSNFYFPVKSSSQQDMDVNEPPNLYESF